MNLPDAPTGAYVAQKQRVHLGDLGADAESLLRQALAQLGHVALSRLGLSRGLACRSAGGREDAAVAMPQLLPG